MIFLNTIWLNRTDKLWRSPYLQSSLSLNEIRLLFERSGRSMPTRSIDYVAMRADGTKVIVDWKRAEFGRKMQFFRVQLNVYLYTYICTYLSALPL